MATGWTLRRAAIALVASMSVLVASSCVPPTPPPPPPTTILSQYVVAAGGTIQVAAPDNRCIRGSYANFYATATMPNGIVAFTGYGYWWQGIGLSGYGSGGDQFATVRIPPFAAAGTYLVYLSCGNYLDSYQFSPATLTVTPYLG